MIIHSNGTSNSNYTGRFAPSPTGPLHFGSLVAALASFLDARHNHGLWLLRIEDLDPPRESIAAPEIIIQQLRSHGLLWDGDILYQSMRLHAYKYALDKLAQNKLVFPCDCIRKNLPPVYPGTCRHKSLAELKQPVAFRILMNEAQINITDTVLGDQHWNARSGCGDFIIKRKDGLFAYQLAVVVDDGFQKVTHVVRGADLLESTPRQVYLAQKLDLPVMNYTHIPLVLGQSGDKLSKQSHAAAIDEESAPDNLIRALGFLGQVRPSDSNSVNSILKVAIDKWDVHSVPKQAGLIA